MREIPPAGLPLEQWAALGLQSAKEKVQAAATSETDIPVRANMGEQELQTEVERANQEAADAAERGEVYYGGTK